MKDDAELRMSRLQTLLTVGSGTELILRTINAAAIISVFK